MSALVLDPGYIHTRAGFAGEDVPKAVIPSFYAHFDPADGADGPARDVFGDDILAPSPGLSIRNYMGRDGVVEDWDVATRLWEHALVHRLQPDRVGLLSPAAKKAHNGNDNANGGSAGADGDGDVAMDDAAAPAAAASAAAAAEDDVDDDVLDKALADAPLLLTEPAWNPPKARERAIELAMEKWGVPAFWLTRTPVAAAFAAGKPTALVVDVGGAGACVAAVHDGMVLRRSVQRSPAGGLWLSGQIRDVWAAADPRVDVVPTYLVENKTAVDAGAPAQARLRSFAFDVHPSFRAHAEERVLTEFKESVVEVWRGPGRFAAPGNEDYARAQPGRVFEMPDGANQMWRESRYRATEGLWDETAAAAAAAAAPEGAERLAKGQTLPELIRAALGGCDVDLRPNLLNNVVVTGSTSLINGFNDRLNNELTAMHPGLKIKIHAAGLTSERRFGAWIGGSILASLGSFHQMWISRKEYEENGVAIVEKRCK